MTPETVRCQYQLSPGTAVIGGGALTGGVNRLPPVGLIDFSVVGVQRFHPVAQIGLASGLGIRIGIGVGE